MAVLLKVWTSEKTGEVRVYANAFREGGEMAHATGAYFVAADDGTAKVGGFRPCWSGNYGRAAQAVFAAFRMDGMMFADLLSLIADSQTAGGNFSEARFFRRFKEAA